MAEPAENRKLGKREVICGSVDITVPTIVTLEVVDAAGPIRGGSDAELARLDTGLEIMVPLFIAPGEKIRVDMTGRKYAGRESEARK